MERAIFFKNMQIGSYFLYGCFTYKKTSQVTAETRTTKAIESFNFDPEMMVVQIANPNAEAVQS
jgi:hypothetical protein